MSTIKDYEILLKSDSSVVFHIFGLAICVIGFLIHVPLLCVVGFVFAYTGFDVLGYKWALHHRYGIESLLEHVPDEIRVAYRMNNFEPARAGYRMMQHPYAIFISLLSIPLVGWMPVLIFWLLWDTGLCDVLYYVCIGQELPGSWGWVSWVLPLGFVFRIFGRDLPNWAMITNVFFGIVVAIIIQFL